jgi:hypothetical protein
MSAAKHTPGPWHVKQLMSYVDQFEIRGPRDSGVMVARTIEWGSAAEGDDPSEANARLIAAAPELLEALQEMVDEINSGDEPGHGSPWHDKARAAIAKATGSVS